MLSSDISQGGKEAASNVAEGAKGVVELSQKEAEVAGTGDAKPSGECISDPCLMLGGCTMKIQTQPIRTTELSQ